MRTRLFGLLLLITSLLPAVAFAQRNVWVAVMVIYQAPADAIDWQGPWIRSKAFVSPNFFQSESECRRTTEQLIAKMHEGMKAPIQFQCALFSESLR